MNSILQGDVREKLKEIPDELVDCCVTSPPYWGLRDYKLPDVIWGENNCEHEWGIKLTKKQSGGDISKHWKTGGIKDFDLGIRSQGNFCLKCSAWRGSLGLEPTPELYVQHLTLIFREVRRVLKKEATLWLNLGDCYMSHSANSKNVGGFQGEQIKKNPLYADAEIICASLY